MPWKPGASGNARGAPRKYEGDEAERAAAARIAYAARKTAKRVAAEAAPLPPLELTMPPHQDLLEHGGQDAVFATARIAERYATQLLLRFAMDESLEPKERISASRSLLQGWGAAPRQIDVQVGPRDLRTLSREDLEAIASGQPPKNALVIEHESVPQSVPQENLNDLSIFD